ncbi:MAG: NAD(P)/FAD-dependent oxidoreductase [Promethearchaeota archaeon]
MMKDIRTDVLVIGAGPAGLTAALYLKRANHDVVILKGKAKSSLELAHEIRNYPGFKSISGQKLHELMYVQVLDAGVEVVEDDAFAFSLTMQPKMVSAKKNIITADSVIIAMGKGARKPLMVNEDKFIGLGVSYCATCDGPLYRGKDVCLVGNDDEAAEDVLILDQMGCRVTWILHKKRLGDLSISQEMLDSIADKEIPVIESADKFEVLGSNTVNGLKYEDPDGKSRQVDTNCIFIIAALPTVSVLQQTGLELSDKKTLVVDRSQQTNIEGVFACGDICGNGYQVSIAVGEGSIAGLNAAKYLRGLKRKK